MNPATRGACAASALILAGQAARFPSPLQDAVTGRFLPEYRLELPWGHLLTTPFSAAADMITYNSARQDAALILYILLGYWLWRRRLSARELGRYLAYLAAAAAFLAWAILAPRPAARLVPPDPDLAAVDFHSHTRYSHDGRGSFTPEANRAWHKAAGFSAAFVTDHNTVEGARRASELSDPGYRSLMGEEVSLQDTHVGVLGNRVLIDNKPYDGSSEGVRRFLGDCEKLYGGLPVLNLPEYWLHHEGRLEEMILWGARGIEIVNATPKGLDFPEEKRRAAVELARRHGLFLAGVSDNHGWGRTSFVWSVLRIPGAARMAAPEFQAALLDALRTRKFSAVSVVVRVKHPPDAGPAVVLDPLLSLWTLTRTFSRAQAAVFLAWIWAAALGALFPANLLNSR